jgi:hypothetical protein
MGYWDISRMIFPFSLPGFLLKPLGHPANNNPKHFLATMLEDLRRDEKWHARPPMRSRNTGVTKMDGAKTRRTSGCKTKTLE